MARKPQQNVIESHAVVEMPGLASAVEAQNALMVRTAEVAKRFGDGLPYDRSRYLDKCRYHMARSAEEALEVGRCLIVMKENEPHGEFIECVEGLGIAYRLAARMMQATLKFSNVSTSTHLIEAAKSKSKLFELLVLDDEELKELGAGGTVAGLKLDDVERMSVRELKGALRDARENSEAKDKLLATKNEKIDTLSAKLSEKKRRVPQVSVDEEGAEIRKEASAYAFEAEAAIRGNLRAAFQALQQHGEKHGDSHGDFMAGLVCQIEAVLREVRSEFDIKAAPDGDDVPAWIKAEATAGGQAKPN